MRVVSRDPNNAFEIELTGRDIKPQSVDRLVWLIDGTRIELLSLPRQWDLSPSASDLEVLHAFEERELSIVHSSGWAQQGTEEQFAFPTGETCLAFVVGRHTPELMLYAATVNGGNVIILVASQVDPVHVKQTHDYLQRTLLSVQRGKRRARLDREQNPANVGGTLLEQIRLFEALTGQTYVALLNTGLMTPRDAKVGAAIPLDSVTLEEVALVEMQTGRPVVAVSVFDGQLAHAINLMGYDEGTADVKYFDPWGKGSFLARGSNHAGVSAIPHPTEARMWLVASDQLRRVLYAVFLELSEVNALFRTCTLLAGPPDRAIATYLELQSLDPKNPEVSDERLGRIQALLVQRQQFRQAVTLYRVRAALDPSSATDKPRIRAALQAAGQTSMISELDQPAGSSTFASPLRASLSDAKHRTDFFAFFHLEEAGSVTDENHNRVISFKPTAPRFHDWVDMRATVTSDDTVSLWSLSLARAFIDDPQWRLFAADVAKSFLKLTILNTGNGAAGDVTKEIWNGEATQVPLSGARVPNTAVPAVASEAYLTYSGTARRYAHRLSGGILRLENIQANGSSYVVISVDSRQ